MGFNLLKKELKILDEILGYRKVGVDELTNMVNFARKHIDATTNVCSRCPSEIRFLHKRIVSWSNTNEEKINKLRYGKGKKSK